MTLDLYFGIIEHLFIRLANTIKHNFVVLDDLTDIRINAKIWMFDLHVMNSNKTSPPPTTEEPFCFSPKAAFTLYAFCVWGKRKGEGDNPPTYWNKSLPIVLSNALSHTYTHSLVKSFSISVRLTVP